MSSAPADHPSSLGAGASRGRRPGRPGPLPPHGAIRAHRAQDPSSGQGLAQRFEVLHGLLYAMPLSFAPADELSGLGGCACGVRAPGRLGPLPLPSTCSRPMCRGRPPGPAPCSADRGAAWVTACGAAELSPSRRPARRGRLATLLDTRPLSRTRDPPTVRKSRHVEAQEGGIRDRLPYLPRGDRAAPQDAAGVTPGLLWASQLSPVGPSPSGGPPPSPPSWARHPPASRPRGIPGARGLSAASGRE